MQKRDDVKDTRPEFDAALEALQQLTLRELRRIEMWHLREIKRIVAARERDQHDQEG